MLEKEKIFSKFNVTDYNEKIEEILEKKHFSEEAENLLLSMFYKVEGCYKDYGIVRNCQIAEKDFIEKLMQIIDYNCDEIRIIKPIIGQQVPKYKINKKEKIIEVFPNEFNLLYALYLISSYSVKKDQEVSFFSRCMLTVLNFGNAMNNSEVIRDFTGWAWEIATNEIGNIENNIFYQNMSFLLEESFLESNLSNIEIESVIEEKFLYIFGKEQSKIAIKKMQQLVLAIYSNMSSVKKRNILMQIKKIQTKLNELENKTEYIAKLKEINTKKIKKIRKIDKILGSYEITKKEFIKRNETLSHNERIFSIGDFINILEKEKKRAAVIINENNNLINPLNYARKLNDVKNEYKKYKELKIGKNSNADIDKYLIDFQIIFIEGMSNKIKNANNKKDLINLVYEFRYYNFIPYKNGVKLKFDKRIEEKWEDVCIELIEKLLDDNVIDVMAENGKLNYDIVKFIFQTKIMKIENINIKLTKYDNVIEVEYFDGNTLEEKLEFEVKGLKKIRIKSERRVKLFN